MTRDEVLNLPSMPAAGPSYPAGPYRFIDREYMVISYETDAAAVADLPVRKMIGAHHFIADLTLPYRRVAFGYNRAD